MRSRQVCRKDSSRSAQRFPFSLCVAAVRDVSGVDGIRFNIVAMDSGGNPALGTTATDGGFSPFVQLFGGPGAYYVVISKNGGGIELYQTNLQCLTSGGGAVVTAVTLVQNQ